MVLCTTLKLDDKFFGNFFWLDMGLTSSEKESNTLSGAVFTKVEYVMSGYMYLYLFALNFIQFSNNWKFD